MRCACHEICNLHFEVHIALCLPRNLHFEVHQQVLRLSHLHFEVHHVLHLSRNLPAGNTGRGWSWLRCGGGGGGGEGEGREGGEGEGGDGGDIKSNNPHLTGGEKQEAKLHNRLRLLFRTAKV